MQRAQLAIGNLDATLIAQVPRLAPHRERMQAELAVLLGAGPGRVNLKITSTDRLGDLGREQGIAALCVVLLERNGSAA
jgi:2-C-methyl-D-erythritol 2,4-cyclodiphosphate synthase